MATGTNNITSVYDLWSTFDALEDISSVKMALTPVYGTYSSTAAPETKNQWGTGLCPSKASWLKLNNYNISGTVEVSGTYTNDQLVKYTDLIYKYLKLSVSTWNPSSSAGTKTISVTCSGSFTVSSNQSWLTVSSTSGSGSKNITLSVTENTSIENSRSGVVTFVGDGITKEINVIQDARDAVIAYELEISGETAVSVNKTIQLTATLYKTVDGVRTESTNVTNDCNWTVSVLSNYASVNNVSNKGLVTGLKNTYSSQATIKATYSSYSATYKISVADDISYEFVITSNVDEIQVGDIVTFTATLYTNTNGTVGESNKTATCTWSENSNNTIVENYSIGSFKGLSAGTVTITATWTNSNGIVFSDSKSITVNASDSIVISPKTWTVPVGGESKIITITANNNWTVNNIPNWITIDTTSGTGNGSITLSANANDSTSQRSESINFVCGNSSATLSVSQSGKAADSITVTPTSWSPESGSNSTYVSITANGSWTATSNQSWLTVGTTSGASITNKSIKLSVTENTSTSRRDGAVTFVCGTATATVSVSQSGKSAPDPVITYEIDLKFRDGYENSVYISKYTYFDIYLYTITDGVKDNGVKLNTLVLQNDVTWTVSDTNIVEPLEGYPYAYSGLVPGTTTITASYTYNNQTLTSSEIVTVLPSFINTNLSSHTFNATGGTKDVIVTCSPNVIFVSVSEVDVNGNSNSVSWLSNTKTTNDDGSFTYTLTCTENTSTNDRTVYVKFYSSLYDKPYKTVKITQSGAAEVVYTMTFTDFNQLLDCLNSNSSYYIASAYDWTIYEGGDNYPEFHLSYDDGAIVGTLQQWTNLYNSIYDPEAESNQIVLINDDDQVVNVSNADFYTGIKSIVNSGNRFVSVEISPVCTMYMRDWETTVGEKLPEGDGCWELYSARDNSLNGGDYPESYLYYFDGSYRNFIEGRIWQWCNLKNYVYNELDNEWDSLKFVNYDSSDETTNFDFDNFHDGVTHIINTTGDAYIRFFYENTGGGGSGSTSNTYTIPFNYRATDGVREVGGDFKVTIYSNNGNTYTSGWMSFAGGENNGDDNHTHNIGSVTFTINGNNIGVNNIYFKVEYSDRSTKLGTRLQIREYFDSWYSVVGDTYYFENYNWVADDSSSPYLQNGTFNFTDSLQNDPNGFIEFTFSDDV